MSDSITVAIKLRPPIEQEKDEDSSIEWIVQGNSIVSLDPETIKRGNSEFNFDYIFDSDATNYSVFDSIVKPIVNATINGINGTVFCYGQYRSGKTYIMMGNNEEPGIIPLCIRYIFKAISNTTRREFLLRVSYLEIINETVNDLLNKDGIDLQLHTDDNKHVVVNCKEEIANSLDSMLSIMKKGNRNRRTREINKNECIKDHRIFQITIESREIDNDSTNNVQVSQLNLVDLAGFECAHEIGVIQEQQIDKSLSCFEYIIAQLSKSENVQKDIDPYNSKLTELLESSLGGNSLTAIIFTVIPVSSEETCFTLSFASQAKNMKTTPKKNEVTSDISLLTRYSKQLTKLQRELQNLRNGNSSVDIRHIEPRLQEKYQNNCLLEERIKLLKAQIVSGCDGNRAELFKCKSRKRQSWCNPGASKSQLPVFQNKSGLPTIKEMSPEKPYRKDNVQSVEVTNQISETAFTDFEINLIESNVDSDAKEKANNAEEEDIVFPDVFPDEFKGQSTCRTPEKQDSCVQTSSNQGSPTTPKQILRKYIYDLTKDFNELREFTTLEKQLLREEDYSKTHTMEEQLADECASSNPNKNEICIYSSDLMIQLEEKRKLSEELELKIQELDEIKHDVQSLKLGIETLQKTIYLLTSENMEMSAKLNAEKERSKEAELNFKETIDELYARIAKVMEEKIHLESNLTTVNEQLRSLRSKASEVLTTDQLLVECHNKIDALETENIELAAIVAEKNKELENIKESKSLLYDHECIYKDRVAPLTEKNDNLVSENSELSTDLMDKIEENEMLRKECDSLKNKIALTEQVNSDGNDVEQLRSENNILKAEITELKLKVTMLSEENVKISNNLFETMEDLDNSRREKLVNASLFSSEPFNNSIKAADSAEQVLLEEDRETLVSKIATLQEKVNHLTCLNTKLSDLKLSSCDQCSHLRNLKDSRRALKLEAKILNRKLEDLQKKFDQKCADTEVLKLKLNQDLNLSFTDGILNASITDGMNVSFIEEKVQHLNNELQSLKDDNDKLSILYREKCDELEKLHDEVDDSKNVDPKPKKHVVKHESRIEKIQTSIDQVRDDIDELKKNGMNFTSILNKFKTEKASLLDEINTLRSMNEELQQKVSDTEITAATAAEKAQILETELFNMSKEIEQYSLKEKEIQSEKLMLEVELENKDILITGLHKTVDELNECISSLKNELDLMTNQKNELTACSETIEQKYKDELELLKTEYQKLEVEKKQSTDSENRATLWANELETDIEKLQIDLGRQESLYKEVQEKVSHLESLLNESEHEKEILKQNLQTLETLLIDSKDNPLNKYKTEFESIKKSYNQYMKESEIKISKINETLNKYVHENNNITAELAKLQDIESKLQKMKESNEHMKEELNTVRESMIKELKSLKHKVNSVDFLSKTANEIFIIFLQTIMSKEKDVIKTMREVFEKDKQQLVDDKGQSADAEKRAILWARELEIEIEKLQVDLTNHEAMHKQQQDEIYELKNLIKEVNCEKEMFKEKVETLEADLNNLQADIDKQCKVDNRQEEEIIRVQKMEKDMQELYKIRETELQQKMKSQKETYEKRMEELMCTIESYKTKNLELKGNIEGYEANEKQLKNIIEANALELEMNNQAISKMNTEFEQLTKVHKEINCEVQRKESRIEEMSALLKSKCDIISEYKAKFDAIMPDYEMLKDQTEKRKACIEQYKQQIGELNMEKKKQIEMLKDKLNSEEIKNVGLNKQLHELNNKNIALVEELDILKEKVQELQRANAKLEKKIRNSTSKMKAEADMEDLRDTNKRLQNNLEGASNRITELQDSKNKVLKELVNLKSQYELLSQENTEIKATLSSYKSGQNVPSSLQVDSRYDALLQEKNKIALELEGKTLLLNQKDKEITDHFNFVQELTVKNEELVEQLRNHAAIIHHREKEISRLKDKLYVHRIESKLINELEEKVRTLKDENQKLQGELDTCKMVSQIDIKQVEEIKLHSEKIFNTLWRENVELQEKLAEYENKLDSKSSSSNSRCSASPAFEVSRRRYSRNKVFNEKRQIENQMSDVDSDENRETCEILRKKIQELELQIVSKTGQIAALEIQIQSENFPYHQKCKELEEVLLSLRNKNAELNSEVRNLQRALCDINAWECDTCRKWRINKRDQCCQTSLDKTSGLLTLNNGLINDHAKIMKLEKEKAIMKDVCRLRYHQIKELEDKVKELSKGNYNGQYINSAVLNKQLNSEKNMKLTMKEIVPANLLVLKKPSNYTRNIWNSS
ncbi:uncharacterized protein LOC116424434 isoform X1 [Nomia melanderi]|uniref:uncharacterized protein LOC116424434 isoform X1 n=2 Tax=Nomia melanderi TaxID=2448451 RepID=UPI003FCDBC99